MELLDGLEDAHSDVADEVDYLPTEPEKIIPGIFTRIQVLSGNRKCAKYRYIAKVPNDLFTLSLEGTAQDMFFRNRLMFLNVNFFIFFIPFLVFVVAVQLC